MVLNVSPKIAISCKREKKITIIIQWKNGITLDQMIKINISNKGQMDIVDLQM